MAILVLEHIKLVVLMLLITTTIALSHLPRKARPHAQA
jgi:hypothetical protein